MTCPHGNHLTGGLLSVLLRVARSHHPPARTTPTRGPCAPGPPSARSALQTNFLLGALPRLAPAGHLLAFQGSALQPATTNLPRASHTSVNSPALKCWWITEDSFKKTTYSSGQKTELHAWAIAGSVTPQQQWARSHALWGLWCLQDAFFHLAHPPASPWRPAARAQGTQHLPQEAFPDSCLPAAPLSLFPQTRPASTRGLGTGAAWAPPDPRGHRGHGRLPSLGRWAGGQGGGGLTPQPHPRGRCTTPRLVFTGLASRSRDEGQRSIMSRAPRKCGQDSGAQFRPVRG